MYQHILVAVEHSKADEAILEHIQPLAHMTKARLLLVHVADGFAARHFNDLQLRESDEMRDDRAYLASAGPPSSQKAASTRVASWRWATRRRKIYPARQAPSTWISLPWPRTATGC